jgi:hypothetical protein
MVLDGSGLGDPDPAAQHADPRALRFDEPCESVAFRHRPTLAAVRTNRDPDATKRENEAAERGEKPDSAMLREC